MHRSVNPAALGRHGNLAPPAAMPVQPLGQIGLAIDDTVYHLAHDYPGGVPALAVRMGMSQNSLAHKVSLTQRTHHLSPTELVKLQAMAAALGFVALPSVAEIGGSSMEDFARVVREFAELLTAVTETASDGSVTMNEMHRVEREAGDVIRAINGMLGHLRALMPSAPGAAG